MRPITKFAKYDESTREVVIFSQSGKELLRIQMEVEEDGGCTYCPCKDSTCDYLFVDCAGTTFGDVCSGVGFRHHPSIGPKKLKALLKGNIVKKGRCGK